MIHDLTSSLVKRFFDIITSFFVLLLLPTFIYFNYFLLNLITRSLFFFLFNKELGEILGLLGFISLGVWSDASKKGLAITTGGDLRITKIGKLRKQKDENG